MANCPFWSNKAKIVACYEECPMNRVNTSEDCVFTLYLSSYSVERETFKRNKLSRLARELDFEDIEEEEVDFIGSLRYLTGY